MNLKKFFLKAQDCGTVETKLFQNNVRPTLTSEFDRVLLFFSSFQKYKLVKQVMRWIISIIIVQRAFQRVKFSAVRLC